MNRNKFLLLFLFLYLSINSYTQNLYNIDSIRTIYLDFYDANWEAILEFYSQNDMDNRVLAKLTVNGIVYDSVGVRFKGNSSLNATTTGDKRPFNIKIDYIKNQDLWGYETLKLSNMFKDPSFVREVLSFEILRNYMPASEANFLVVYTDGVQRGLYANTESVNKNFLSKHFGSNNNSFFKCDPVSLGGVPPPPPQGCSTATGIASAFVELGTDTACYKNYYELKSDSDIAWIQLTNMILELNGNVANVDQLLDVDRSLWMLAFNNVFVNMDSYTGSGHNYYTYENQYGIFNNIIWDLNENFGVFTQGMTLGQLISLHPYYNDFNIERPLIKEIFSISDYRKRYMAHFRTLIDEQIANNAMKNRAVELQALIDTCVLNDPEKLFSYTDFQNSLNTNIGVIPGINVLMDQRYSYFQTQPDILLVPPVLSVQQSILTPSATDSVWIIATTSNASQVWLHYRTDIYAPFGKYQMYDDGNHNDSLSGDGIYGACIPACNAGEIVQYYVYAENTDAGIFSPARAEYEFYEYSVAGINQGDIVINEIMASNFNTQADESGEFDDWVELYNNTANSISLKNMFLSDDVFNKAKWAFPDTVIGAHDFFIVWTDNDQGQPGVHASFKLSSNGEMVVLSDYYGNIYDSISFGVQNSAETYGRFVNGTGNFMFMPPTFSATNKDYSGIDETKFENNVLIYPNPVKERLYVKYLAKNNKTDIKIKIYNIVMQEVISDVFDSGNYITTIRVSDLSDGIYIIKVGDFTSKFIISK